MLALPGTSEDAGAVALNIKSKVESYESLHAASFPDMRSVCRMRETRTDAGRTVERR